jgi:hypothetical protein
MLVFRVRVGRGCSLPSKSFVSDVRFVLVLCSLLLSTTRFVLRCIYTTCAYDVARSSHVLAM